MPKIDIKVKCAAKEDYLLPEVIVWPDGRDFKIDRVLHSCSSPDLSYNGVRYTVLIRGHERYLYHTGDQWYVNANAGTQEEIASG